MSFDPQTIYALGGTAALGIAMVTWLDGIQDCSKGKKDSGIMKIGLAAIAGGLSFYLIQNAFHLRMDRITQNMMEELGKKPECNGQKPAYWDLFQDILQNEDPSLCNSAARSLPTDDHLRHTIENREGGIEGFCALKEKSLPLPFSIRISFTVNQEEPGCTTVPTYK